MKCWDVDLKLKKCFKVCINMTYLLEPKCRCCKLTVSPLNYSKWCETKVACEFVEKKQQCVAAHESEFEILDSKALPSSL